MGTTVARADPRRILNQPGVSSEPSCLRRLVELTERIPYALHNGFNKQTRPSKNKIIKSSEVHNWLVKKVKDAASEVKHVFLKSWK